MRHLLATSALLALFAAVPAVYAQDHHDDKEQGRRYYDAKHKDYHSWNSDEDKMYHDYAQQNHRKEQDFDKLSKREQSQYWDYRHQH